MSGNQIIIFDGKCDLCARSVQFIRSHDSQNRFECVPAQSPAGQDLQAKHGIDALAANTLVLIQDGEPLTRSEAALAISRQLDGRWKALGRLSFLPRRMRDGIYRLVARNRQNPLFRILMI